MSEKTPYNPLQPSTTPSREAWVSAAEHVQLLEDAQAALDGIQSNIGQRIDDATQQRRQEALRILLNGIMPPADITPSAAPALEVAEDEEVSREVVNLRGIGPVDLSTYPEGHQIRLLAAEQAKQQSKGIAAAELQPGTSSRFWTRKRIGVAAFSAIILAGGGIGVMNFVSSSTTAAIAGDKNVSPVNPETVPPLAPAVLAEAFVGCLDDKGAGNAINVGSVTSEVNSAWLMDLNGKSYKAEFQLGVDAASIAKPTVELEGYVDYAACIPADQAAAAVTIATETAIPEVTVNLDAITPEAYVGINKFDRGYPIAGEEKLAGMNVMTAAAVTAKAIPEETAKALNDSYVDKANAAAEITAAQRHTADLLTKADGMYASQGLAVLPDTIKKAINAKVATLKSQGLSLVDSVNVKFIGKLKAMVVKNAEVKKADKFSVDPATLTITGFAVTAPAPTPESKK
jgi:hypothetical protein